MNRVFRKYVEEKLVDSGISSDVEKFLIEAADRFHLSGDVSILIIYEETLNIYRGSVNSSVSPSRIAIHEIGEDVAHGLNEILSCDEITKLRRDSLFAIDDDNADKLIYDSYFDQYYGLEQIKESLEKEFSALNLADSDKLLVINRAYPDPVLQYFLQSLGGDTYILRGYREDVLTSGRIEISSPLESKDVGLPYPMNRIGRLIGNGQAIFVPLHPATLTSKFSGDYTWEKLLGRFSEPDESDAEISGVHCRVITLHPDIDSYGNLFMTVRSVMTNEHITHLISGPGLKIERMRH